MNTMHIVQIKKPFTSAVLKDHISGGIYPSKESDNHRVKRENIGNMLENLTGKKPVWMKRSYCYHTILTEDQIEEVMAWNMVRSIQEKK